MTAAALAEGGLPELAQERLAERPAPEPAEPEPPPGAPPSLKVLFVDDEEEFVRTMAARMELRDLGGDVALSGEQALTMLREDTPDVIVLDLRMPGMDGLEVLRQVKATYPQIEVVVMTGRGSEQDEETARQLGAFAYLTKPVDINTLMETVRSAGRARARAT
jgi:CheY-like chemotaxis protein